VPASVNRDLAHPRAAGRLRPPVGLVPAAVRAACPPARLGADSVSARPAIVNPLVAPLR
jgi:hypothetical protein